MKRPQLVHFMAIETEQNLGIRASVTLSRGNFDLFLSDEERLPTSPWQSLGLLMRKEFRLKIVGLDEQDQEVTKKTYESDPFGNFNIKMRHHPTRRVTHLQVYEVSTHPGLELHIGSYIPIQLYGPKKIVISDFDKTLVDTRYSTAKELYNSLRKPLNFFPSITPSIEILQNYIKLGYQPFILTASPHFYETAIRDWLYQNEIYTAGIFLKDYRRILSLLEGDLTPKDFKAQGFYKLGQLVNILLMTGIPEELVLMGDGFESDPLIYLTLAVLLNGHVHPWNLWNRIRGQEAFQLTNKQNSKFLNDIYQLDHQIKNSPSPALKIFIRKPKGKVIERPLPPLLSSYMDLIEFYEA